MSSGYAVEANEVGLIHELAEAIEMCIQEVQFNSGQIQQKDEWRTPQVYKYFMPKQKAPNELARAPRRDINSDNAPDVIAYYPAVIINPVSGSDDINYDTAEAYNEVKINIEVLVSQVVLTERVEFAMLLAHKIRAMLNNLCSGILGNQYFLQSPLDWQADNDSAAPQFVVMIGTTWRYHRALAKSILNNME